MSKWNKITNFLKQQLQLNLRRNNYEIIGQLKLRYWHIFLLFIAIIITSFSLFYVIIAYTPIESTLPDFPTSEVKEMMNKNFLTTDSLLKEIEKQEKYLKMIKDFVYDEIPIDEEFVVNPNSLTEKQIKEFNDPTFERKQIHTKTLLQKSDELIQMFLPMKGEIINSFDESKNHYGIDIMPSGKANVLATLSGTVLLSDYTVKFGYTIIIQHNNDIISVYKHCSSILVSQGDFVVAGRVIATCDNMREKNSEQQLHFEVWKRGNVINPQNYLFY
ncbi:MAG: M23 family metallopeptidase [Bacteroidales bacterium]|jgi:lipoprotein NlpD|nr:M23 family metallopeptidase [Bacteroidales bacterium]